MSDMRQLREALRTREALAPDPDAVLAGVRGRIRRRRAQRRMAAAAAAVAVVIAGAGVGMSLLRHSDEPESIEAAAGSVDQPVAAPALPFTVDGLPSGMKLRSWMVAASVASGVYDGYYDSQMEIILSGGDAGDGVVAHLAGGGMQVQRRIAPGKVITILTKANQFPDGRLVEIARSVRLVPAPVPSSLRALRAPAGLTVRQWSGGAGSDYLTLCPPEVPVESPLRVDGRCYAVTVSLKPAARTSTTTIATPIPQAPKAVTRVLGGGPVLTVQTEQGTEAVMEAIAASAVGS